MTPEMIPTPESTTVLEIGYDEDLSEVWVAFDSGSTYVYSDVSRAVWDEFQAAPSKGQFVAYVLRGAYQYRRL
jgi:lysyl-tRNA synthetase class 2